MRLCVEFQNPFGVALGIWHDAPAVPRIDDEWECGPKRYRVDRCVWFRRNEEVWAVLVMNELPAPQPREGGNDGQ